MKNAKKLLILISMILLALPFTVALADVTIFEYDIVSVLIGDNSLVYTGDKLVITGSGLDVNDIYSYNIATKNLSLTYTLSSGEFGVVGESIYHSDTGYVYYFGSETTSLSYKIRTDGTGYETITKYPLGIKHECGCSLKPNSDEVYCFYDNTFSATTISKYDISEDSWSSISEDSTYYDITTIAISSCSFRNENDFYCVGGDLSGTFTNKGLIYHIDTNTTEHITLGDIGFQVDSCIWQSDIMYCYGMMNQEEENLNITYYDPTTNTSDVILDTEITLQYASCDGGYCLGGYDSEWDYSDIVYQFILEEPCEENWVAECTNGTCLINDSFSSQLDYTDLNSCGTYDNLPIDYGTITWQSCDYCDEFGCGYEPTYNANDVAPIVIDGIGTLLVTIISLLGIIVVFLGYNWTKKQIKK